MTTLAISRWITAAGSRLRHESGFGLVELLIAMTVLNVGILAVFAGFSSGYAALNRGTAISSASALGDAQLERFRALRFTAICLSNTSTVSNYTANAPGGTAVPTCTTSDPALVALRAPTTGPDNHAYRVDTYVVWNCAKGTLSVSTPYTTAAPGCLTDGVAQSRVVKLVRVVVRSYTGTAGVYSTGESTFDQSTGG